MHRCRGEDGPHLASPRDRLQGSFNQHSGVAVKAVPTWLPLQDVLGLHGRDLGHGGEDVGAVHRRPLQAVAVVDLPLARLPVDVKLEHTQQDGRVNGAVPWSSGIRSQIAFK